MKKSTGAILATALVVVVGTVASAALLSGRFGWLDQFTMDPALRGCDIAVRNAIKSPATYRRADATLIPDKQAAVIDFDSQNGFGAMLRSTAECNFALQKDNPNWPDSWGYFSITAVTIDGDELPQPLLLHATIAADEAGVGAITPDKTELQLPAK